MAPMTAIQSATVVTAKLLDIWEETGSITAGKAADLIAVEGDPIADVTKLQDVRFVMRVGQVHKSPAELSRQGGDSPQPLLPPSVRSV